MNPGVSQVMLGLAVIVGSILVIIKGIENDFGWIVFVAGVALAIRGGIVLSVSGAKEIGN